MSWNDYQNVQTNASATWHIEPSEHFVRKFSLDTNDIRGKHLLKVTSQTGNPGWRGWGWPSTRPIQLSAETGATTEEPPLWGFPRPWWPFDAYLSGWSAWSGISSVTAAVVSAGGWRWLGPSADWLVFHWCSRPALVWSLGCSSGRHCTYWPCWVGCTWAAFR